MNEVLQVDIAPVLQAVETLLKATLVMTLSVAVCGAVAYVLCSFIGEKDER